MNISRNDLINNSFQKNLSENISLSTRYTQYSLLYIINHKIKNDIRVKHCTKLGANLNVM